MPLTANPEVRDEVVALTGRFMQAANGFAMRDVVAAAAEMLSAAIHGYGAKAGLTLEQTEEIVKENNKWLLASVRMNWQREPQRPAISKRTCTERKNGRDRPGRSRI